MHNIQGIQFNECKHDEWQLVLHRRMPPVPPGIEVGAWKNLYANYTLRRPKSWWLREWRWVIIALKHAVKQNKPRWQNITAGIEVTIGDDLVATLFEKPIISSRSFSEGQVYGVLRFPIAWFNQNADMLRSVVDDALTITPISHR